MRRAQIVRSRFGIRAAAAPVRLDLADWGFRGLQPAMRGWAAGCDGLREWIGCAEYALR
jgi:hypothetical protein